MGLERRPFGILEIVFDVGGRVIGYVLAVELSLSEVSFYRPKHNIRPRSILSQQHADGQHQLSGDVVNSPDWRSSQ